MPHIHEKIDFAVNVYIVCQDKVLLRKHDKYDVWLGPGGHIELHEDPNEAVIREAWEETGLRVKLLDTREYIEESLEYKELIPPMALNRHQIDAKHEHISFEYIATSETQRVAPQEKSDASSNFKWYSYEEIDTADELRPHVRFLAKKAIEKVRQHHAI